MAYVKLFGSILASTIWREPPTTRVLWITMLALADRDGIVEGSVPGIADLARLSVEECRHALRVLMSPDPDSRTQEHDGRRIVEVRGGWEILNYGYYQDKQSFEDLKEKAAIRQARKRERDKSRLSRLSQNVTPDETLPSDQPSPSDSPEPNSEGEPSEQPAEGSSAAPGSGGEGSGSERVSSVLMDSEWRANSKSKTMEVYRISKRLESEGMTVDQARLLWEWARRNGKDPGAYFDSLLKCESNWRSALEQAEKMRVAR